MSLNLPDHIQLPTSEQRHNLPIAQIALYSIVYCVQFFIRARQEWMYWTSSRRSRNTARCLLRGSFNFVNIVCKCKLVGGQECKPELKSSPVRIAGNAIYLAADNPDKTIVVIIVVLQGV